MNKTIKLFALIALMAISSQSWAQDQGQIRVGGSLALGTKAGISDTGDSKLGVGINIGGDYFIIDNLSAGISYTFFFKSSVSYPDGLGGTYELSQSRGAFNIDGKYYFLTDPVRVYGLLGISIGSAKVTTDVLGSPFTVSDSETGVNIGAGVDYPLSDKLALNGQLKYSSPYDGQLVINLGVFYSIN